MTLKGFSKSDWADWLDNPITEAVRDAVAASLARQQAAATRDYWAGKAWPEADRQSLVRLAAWHEDFFTASFEEIKAAIEDER